VADLTPFSLCYTYILLPNKTAGMYNSMFEAIKGLSDTPLVLDLVSCDYELTLIKKFLLNFPNSKVAGCLFHFIQTVVQY